MALAKEDLFPALTDKLGSVPLKAAMTAAGDSTSVISTALAGFGDDHFNGWHILITSGAESVKWRLVTDYVSSSGDFTVQPALAGAPGGASETFEVHAHNPAFYTLAINEAIRSIYPAVFYPLRNWGGIIAYSNQFEYPVPREFVDVERVQKELTISRKFWDSFNRTASTTAAGTSDSGHSPTAQAGTWGISSNELYSVTDADLDLITWDMDFDNDRDDINGMFQTTIRGTVAHNATYRTPALIFRYLDTSNYLIVRLLSSTTAASGGRVDLRKMDGGSESSLATGSLTTTNDVDYVVRVQYVGSRITVWVDEVELIQYQLLGSDAVKFTGGPLITETPGTTHDKIGYRIDKAGSPGTDARIDDAKFHKWVNHGLVSDWELSQDKRLLLFKATGNRVSFLDNSPLLIEGRRYLTMLTADSTTGTIDSYTTDRVELTADTKELDLLLSYAKYHFYTRVTNPVATRNEKDRNEFRAMAQQAFGEAEAMRPLARMPRLPREVRSA